MAQLKYQVLIVAAFLFFFQVSEQVVEHISTYNKQYEDKHGLQCVLHKIQTENLKMHFQKGLELKVNVSKVKDKDWVEVSYGKVNDPAFDDWVAMFAPAGNYTILKKAPSKYKFASEDPQYMVSGKGTLSFKVVSHRASFQFALLRNGLSSPLIAGTSNVVHLENVNEALQGHLGYKDDNTKMLMQWVTRDKGNPIVKYGVDKDNLDKVAVAESYLTYSAKEMCGEPANKKGYIDPGTTHRADMEDLIPAQRYYYQFGDEQEGMSQIYTFRAAPEVGPDSEVQFFAIADMGQSEDDNSNEVRAQGPSINTTRLMIEDNVRSNYSYQLLIQNGDISYAEGFVTQWDRYFQQVEPLTTAMPLAITLGNHERDWPNSGDRFKEVTDSGGECGIATERRIYINNRSDQPWYSFNFGPIHFLQYSTEHHFHRGTKQWKFMKEDLEKVDRIATPWLIVGGHRPIYISSTMDKYPDGDLTVARDLRDAFEDLFQKHKVDMTWHGHHHSYQRTCPVFKQECQGYDSDGVANAPIHLCIGHAGQGLSYNIESPMPAYMEKTILWWGYMRTFANATSFRCEVVSDLDGSLMDNIHLKKPQMWGQNFMRQKFQGS